MMGKCESISSLGCVVYEVIVIDHYPFHNCADILHFLRIHFSFAALFGDVLVYILPH